VSQLGLIGAFSPGWYPAPAWSGPTAAGTNVKNQCKDPFCTGYWDKLIVELREHCIGSFHALRNIKFELLLYFIPLTQSVLTKETKINYIHHCELDVISPTSNIWNASSYVNRAFLKIGLAVDDVNVI
jgi:hypothetical protein